MTTIVLTPPCAFINSNDRLHFRAKAKLTALWREAGHYAATARPLPRRYERAYVVCSIRFPTNHRRDVGNFYPTAKAIVDGIVSTGLYLTDDDDDHIIGPDLRRDRPNGPPRVTITIRELADQKEGQP